MCVRNRSIATLALVLAVSCQTAAAATGGVVITGDDPRTVVIRARGPSLARFGVPGTLADPMVHLFSGQDLIDSNDNWADHGSAGMIPQDLKPDEPFEAAIYRSLAPGAYTAVVRGTGSTSGIGIVEVFEAD